MLSVRGDALAPLADEWTRAWAAAEERAVNLVLRAFGRLAGARGRRAALAPWLEVYACAEDA